MMQTLKENKTSSEKLCKMLDHVDHDNTFNFFNYS